MTTSNRKFIRYFQEFYSLEFPELDNDFKKNEIEKILLNNNQYITKEEVMNYDGCQKCGRCCREQGCLDFDSNTNLCTRHSNPIHELCRTYPWTGEEMGIAPLTLNCPMMVGLFTDFFDKYFEEKTRCQNASRN